MRYHLLGVTHLKNRHDSSLGPNLAGIRYKMTALMMVGPLFIKDIVTIAKSEESQTVTNSHNHQ